MEEDIEILEKGIKVLTGNDVGLTLDFETTAQAMKKLIKAYKQDEKIIDLMAQTINSYDSQLIINTYKNKENVKEIFREYTKNWGE